MPQLLPLLTLSLMVGVALGLFGGGGSLLTVPMLIYVAKLEPRNAIATSLFVVGVTSSAALASHARRGHVAFRVGASFGVASMAGAFLGGRVAHLISDRVLLVAFTALMVVTGASMLRRQREHAPGRTGLPPGHVTKGIPLLARFAAVGLGIGFLSGLVGAGGGFVIVPALVLIGGLSMPDAIGTSLFVIALNSFAGFLGAYEHAVMAWGLALEVAGASVVGSLAGAALSSRIRPESLRTGFAILVLVTAAFMTEELVAQTALLIRPMSWLPIVPWSSLGGGVLIGLAASLLLILNGRIAGVSGIVGNLLRPRADENAWRGAFIAGLLVGGGVLYVLRPHWFAAPLLSAPLLAVAGVLVGFGARLGGGCTSGHGVCGLARGSRRSLAATFMFMATGVGSAFMVRHVLGAWR